MGYYKIKSHAGTGKLLNIAASGPISGRKNTNIWDESCPIDQTWSIASLGNNQQVKIINNLSYMLNANTSTWNCDVYTSNSDTYVNFEKVIFPQCKAVSYTDRIGGIFLLRIIVELEERDYRL